jgi:hypothetical protein
MLYAQVENMPDELVRDGWKYALNLGLSGIIFFLVVAFIVLILWFMLKGARHYVPMFLDQGLAAFTQVAETQPLIIESQSETLKAIKQLTDLHAKGSETTASIATILQQTADPYGFKYKDHVFSSTRLEEFLIALLELLGTAAKDEDDEAIKKTIVFNAERLKRILERKIENHR